MLEIGEYEAEEALNKNNERWREAMPSELLGGGSCLPSALTRAPLRGAEVKAVQQLVITRVI